MRDMTGYYQTRTTIDLRTLRSIKSIQCKKLEGQPQSWFNSKELMKLRSQIVWINAVLESRRLQLNLL